MRQKKTKKSVRSYLKYAIIKMKSEEKRFETEKISQFSTQHSQHYKMGVIITEMQEKSFKSIFEKLLSERITDEFKETFDGYIQKKNKKISAYDAMAMVQLKKALDGDAKAFELIRDTLGQKNAEAKDKDFGGVVKVMITDE